MWHQENAFGKDKHVVWMTSVEHESKPEKKIKYGPIRMKLFNTFWCMEPYQENSVSGTKFTESLHCDFKGEQTA